ncbi:Tim44 domain-containing protein [Undibacterium fentianense]|uniref:Tim44 domain-containing protein n=1 Tax=Undibacterium fentianense TaxID=2828728 RepID=A0A941E7B3_9BURK|nr:TIM44-like domain-containing protein [Undibacterium fentianense]MBR7801058.1 Tim44 domain-containing protein [Undibacterium fentianense]
MKHILLSIALLFGATTMIVADADAQRMGKRSSFGRQSNNVTQKAPAANAANPAQAAKPGAPNAATPAVPPKPSIPWKGIVGGLIGGALLAGLFSSLGMGGALASAMGSILTFAVIGLLVFMAFRFFTRKKAGNAPTMFNQQPAYAGMPNNNALPEIGSRIDTAPAAFTPASVSTANLNSSGSVPLANQGNWTIPADFDVTGFLRHAKSNYIRLQAAWDRGDMNDIREFTSPEMFAEMKLELQDRGNAKNETDVVTLDAELLGIETQAYDYIASVKFTGMIREGGATNPEAFAEVWNLAKPINGQSGWLLAGIQQLN